MPALLAALSLSGCPKKACGDVVCGDDAYCEPQTETCVPWACSLDADCGNLRYRCSGGRCVPVGETCVRDSDCSDPVVRSCVSGWCVLRQVTCAGDADCADLQVCDRGWCRGGDGFDCTGDPPACGTGLDCLPIDETRGAQRCLRPCEESGECGQAQLACLDLGVADRYCAPNRCDPEQALSRCDPGGGAAGTCVGFLQSGAPVAWCFAAGAARPGVACDAVPTWDAPGRRCVQGAWCLISAAGDETGLCYVLCDPAWNGDPEIAPGCAEGQVCVDLTDDPAAPTLGYCAEEP